MSQLLKLTNDKAQSSKTILDVEILKDSQHETLNLWVGGLQPSDINIDITTVSNQDTANLYPTGIKIGEVYSVSIKLVHTANTTSYFGKQISHVATSEDISELVEAWIALIQERITADTESTSAWSKLVSYEKEITSDGISLKLLGPADETKITAYKGLVQIEGDANEQSLPVISITDIENSANTAVEVNDTLAEILAEKEINTINDISQKGSLQNTIKRLGVINFQDATASLPQVSFIKFDTTEAVFGDIYLLDIDGGLDLKLEVEPNETKDSFIERFATLIQDEGTGAWENVSAIVDLRNKHIRVEGEINVPFGLENIQKQVEQLDAHAYQLEFTNDINFTDDEDRLAINQKLIDKGIRSDEDVTRFSDASFMRQIRFEIGDINAFILRAKAAVRGQLKSKIAEGLRTQALYNNTAPEFGNTLSTGGAAASDITEVGTDTISQLNSRFSQQVYCDPNNTAVSPTAYLADLTNYVLTYLKNNSADPNEYHWTGKDIGDSIQVEGNSEITDDKITIQASGANIWKTTDEFRFVYKKVQGNGEFIAKITNYDNKNPWTKTGLMIRQDLTPNSVHVFGHIAAPITNGKLLFSSRKNVNTNTGNYFVEDLAGLPSNDSNAYYLKLSRTLSSYIFSYSTNGDDWIEVGSIDKSASLGELQGEFYIGLALTSDNETELASASFEDIQLSGFSLPNGVQRAEEISLEELEGLFHQNFAELPAAKDEITDLVCQTRVAIEVLRDYLTTSNQIVSESELAQLTTATKTYFSSVHQGFLRKLGTNKNELVNAKTKAEIARLTSKLGIPSDLDKIDTLLLKTNNYEENWDGFKRLFRPYRHNFIDKFKQVFEEESETFLDFVNKTETTLAVKLRNLESTHEFWKEFGRLIKWYADLAARHYNSWVQSVKVKGWEGGDPNKIRFKYHQHQTHSFRIYTNQSKYFASLLWFVDYVHWNHFNRDGYSMQKLSVLSATEIADIFKAANRKVGDLSTFRSRITTDIDCVQLFANDMLRYVRTFFTLFEQKLEEIFGIEDTTKHPFSDGVIVGDGKSDIIRHKFDGIQWKDNTDEEGNVYVKLSPYLDFNAVPIQIFKSDYTDINQTNWETQDIGGFTQLATELPQITDTSVAINSSGQDIWGQSDNFRFVCKKVSGDGEIITRIEHLGGTNTTALKAGVMLRNSLDPASSHVHAYFTSPWVGGNTSLHFDYREGYASSTNHHREVHGFNTPTNGVNTYFFKLTKEGNHYQFSYSTDGTIWTLFSEFTKNHINDEFYIGFTTAGLNNQSVISANFDSVQVIGFQPTGLIAQGIYDELTDKYIIDQYNNSGLTGEIIITQLPTSGTSVEQISLVPSILSWQQQQLRNNWKALDNLPVFTENLTEEERQAVASRRQARIKQGPVIDPDVLIVSDCKDPYATTESNSPVYVYNVRKGQIEEKLQEIAAIQQAETDINYNSGIITSAIAKADDDGYLYVVEANTVKVLRYNVDTDAYEPVLNMDDTEKVYSLNLTSPEVSYGLTISRKKKGKPAFVTIEETQKVAFEKEQKTKISFPNTDQINAKELFIIDLDNQGSVYFEVAEGSTGTSDVADGVLGKINEAITNKWGNWAKLTATINGNEITLQGNDFGEAFTVTHKPYAVEDGTKILGDPIDPYYDDQLVVSTRNRILFRDFEDLDGTTEKSIGSYGPEIGQYKVNRHLKIINNDLFVADHENQRIAKLTLPEVSTTFFDATQTRQVYDNDSIANPSIGVAVDIDGNQYVADRSNNRLLSFNKQGRFRFEMSASESATINYEFDGLHGVHVDAEGNIYVVENGIADRVSKFDKTGGLQFILNDRNTELTNDGSSLFNVARIARTDSEGNIYVVDTNNHQIKKFDANGLYLYDFGKNDLAANLAADEIGLRFPSDITIVEKESGDKYLLVPTNYDETNTAGGEHGFILVKEEENELTYIDVEKSSSLFAMGSILPSNEEDKYIITNAHSTKYAEILVSDTGITYTQLYDFETIFGGRTNGLWQFNDMSGCQGGIDNEGTIYLGSQDVDDNGPAQLIKIKLPQTYALSGTHKVRSGAKTLSYTTTNHKPIGLDIDKERGYVYVTTIGDGELGKVWRFDQNLKPLHIQDVSDINGNFSSCVKVDREGNFYVVDDPVIAGDVNTIYKYSPEGELLDTITDFEYTYIRDIHFDDQGRYVFADQLQLRRLDTLKGFGKTIETYLIDSEGKALTEKAFVALKKQYFEGVDIENQISAYGLNFSMFNSLVKTHTQLSNGKDLTDEQFTEFHQLITAVWKAKQFESWIEEEDTLGITHSQDYFTLIDRSYEKSLSFKKWLADSRRRRDWKRTLKARIEQQENIIEAHRELISEVEDENLISLRDALIMTADFEGDTLDAKAKDATDKLIIDFKNNCCQKTTRISMAIEALQGVMWGVRNGLTQDTYANLYMESEFFDEEWKWMGSYESWRSSQFVFMYPENLLIPQLRKSHSEPFTEVLEQVATDTLNPNKACKLVNEYYDEIRDLKNLALVTHFEFTKTDERYCISSRENQSGDYVVLISINKASNQFYWTYFETEKPERIRFWIKLENEELSKVDIHDVPQVKLDEDSGNYHMVFIANDLTIKSIEFNVNTFNWETTINDYKIVRELGEPDAEDIKNLVVDRELKSNYIGMLAKVLGNKDEKTGEQEEEYAMERFVLDFSSKEAVFDPEHRIEFNLPGVTIRSDGKDKNAFFDPKLIGMFHGEFLYTQKEKIKGSQATTTRVMVDSGGWRWGWKRRKRDFITIKIPFWHYFHPRYENRTTYKDVFYAATDDAKDLKYEVNYGETKAVTANTSDDFRLIVSAKYKFNGTDYYSFTLSFPDGEVKTLIEEEDGPFHVHNNVGNVNYLSTYYDKKNEKQFLIKQDFTGTTSGEDYIFLTKDIFIRQDFEYDPDEDSYYFNYVNSGRLSLSLKNFQLPKLGLNKDDDVSSDHKNKSKANLELLNNYPKAFKALESELHFDLLISITRELQQNGYYTEALDYYKLVYDWTQSDADVETQRKARSIYHGLEVEADYRKFNDLLRLGSDGSNSTVDLEWLDDPFNPHAVAETRPNSYTKFTVLQIVQCMLDYADSEFTKDTAETVPKARTLYRAAMELLDAESLRHLEDDARDDVNALNYTPATAYQAIWENQKARMLTVEKKATLDTLLIKVKDVLQDTSISDDETRINEIDQLIDTAQTAKNLLVSKDLQKQRQEELDKAVNDFIANDSTIQAFLNASGKKVEYKVHKHYKTIGINQFHVYQVRTKRRSRTTSRTRSVYQYDSSNNYVREYSYRTPKSDRHRYYEITIPDGHRLYYKNTKYLKIWHKRSYYGGTAQVVDYTTTEEIIKDDLSRKNFAEDTLFSTLTGDAGPKLIGEGIIDLADLTGDLTHLNPDFVKKYQYDPLNPTPEQQAFQQQLRDFTQTLFKGINNRYNPSTQYDFCVPANPVVSWLRFRADLNLYKIRNCRNIAGVVRELAPFAAPTDATSGLPFIGSGNRLSTGGSGLGSFKPSIYRYDVLVARAKELTNIAQQVEGSFLAALEKADNESYSLLKAKQDLGISKQGVKLQNLRVRRADSAIGLAELQKERAELQKDHYDTLLVEGLLDEEQRSLDLQYVNLGYQVVANTLKGSVALEESTKIVAGTTNGKLGNVSDTIVKGLVLLGQISGTLAEIFQQEASYIRRQQEWEFASDLADKDIDIADQQIEIAEDDKDIVEQEKAIAELQVTNAQDTIDFLQNKFTSKELYQWMAKTLEDVYRFFLQSATQTAKLAESQLAFERQNAVSGFILDDYWESATGGLSTVSNNGSGEDRRGLTGSVRLLKDIYQLDQEAFLTNKRKLHLTKTVSMASMDPSELIQLKKDGVMNIRTTKRLFDQDFPGHYLRLIKSINIQVIALVPPTDGVKVTLKSSGLSRTEILDSNTGIVQEVPIQRPPETVAYSGNKQENGAYQLSAQQTELLNPFENTGVVGDWTFIMPKAANQFDFSTIADVLFTIEYTALESVDHAVNVVEELGNEYASQLTFSMQTNFADAWYEILNEEQNRRPSSIDISCNISSAYLPTNIEDIKFAGLKMVIVPSANFNEDSDVLSEAEITSIAFTPEGKTVSLPSAGPVVANELGILKSAVNWGTFNSESPAGEWKLEINQSLKELIQNEKIDDIFIVIDYDGTSPEWPELYQKG